jgi:hypothetical protein
VIALRAVAQLLQRVRAQLGKAQVVGMLHLRRGRRSRPRAEIPSPPSRAAMRRTFSSRLLGATDERFVYGIGRGLARHRLLLELAEHVRDARLVVDDLLRAADGAVDVARDDERLRESEASLHDSGFSLTDARQRLDGLCRPGCCRV